MNSPILIVAAHPDDEVLGCGGSIARLSREGNDVHVLILGEGITSRLIDPANANPKAIESLHHQAQSVGDFLGVRSVALVGLPDNRFGTIPLLDVVKIIEEKIEQIKPSTIFAQHGGDLNIDHVIIFRATLTATRPMQESPVKSVYAYEVNSSTEWAFQQFSPVFKPNTFLDISSTLGMKLKAMAMYEGESRTFPHPRSPKAIQARAQYLGSIAGVQAAEAFELIREIR